MSAALPPVSLPTDCLPVLGPPVSGPPSTENSRQPTEPLTVALVGNPNSGKTSLFNRLTGLRATTGNFPGTTVEHRRGPLPLATGETLLIDLPGLYSVDGQDAASPEEQIAKDVLAGNYRGRSAPDIVVVVVDATNLQRNLFLVSQVIDRRLPTIVAVNMIDTANRRGLDVRLAELEAELGCPIVAISARTGQGIGTLLREVERMAAAPAAPVASAELAACGSCCGCQYAARHDWAENVAKKSIGNHSASKSWQTELIDRVLTHRVWGLAAFAGLMVLAFVMIFWLAQYPMDLIDGFFAATGSTIERLLPAGDFSSFLADGVIGGVGGVLVFLPQICILFFMLALLEDSGYLARAALVMDRLMYRVGLPGKAFVPMLSAHACAIPAIMAARVIDDRRDRLATILVIPLMTCSARVPVYAMLAALLFPHQPVYAALLFAGAYTLGIVAALSVALVLKRSLLKGETQPLLIELPDYRLPSLRNGLLQMVDRSSVFVKNAGTTILLISIVMWAAATYPKTSLEELTPQQQGEIAALNSDQPGDSPEAEQLLGQIQLQNSFAGQAGKLVQNVFAPLGFDWKVSVGVMTSFAAREVVVSTLAVLYGMGDEIEEDADSLYGRMRSSRRPDGRPTFDMPTCLSLLVFFVLAMQCLPTQVITKRETGSWKWAAFQFGYMTVLAYVAALATYQIASALA